MSMWKNRLICIVASLNTTNANWFTLWLAEHLGKRRDIRHDGIIVTVAKWRGRSYFMDARADERAGVKP